jgi:hypothetical protein
MGYGAAGASCVAQPVDPRSFTFSNETCTGYQASTQLPLSTPVMIFTALPPASLILVEVVVNLEVIQGASSINGALQNLGRSDTDQPTLSSYFASTDQLLNVAKSYIPSPSTVAEGFAHLASASMSASRIVRGYHSIRNNYFNAPSGANRLTIEELN